MSTQRLIAGVFHLMPLVPLAFGHVYAAIAFALIVAAAYIKTKKLTAQLLYVEEMVPKPWPETVAREAESLRKARDLWRSLTFL